MDFADKLQSYRKQKGLSQENLAEVVGVSRQAVSKWESGQSYPEMDKMIAISELFHVTVDHLVKDTPSDNREARPQIPGPVQAGWRPYFHYEYKSKKTLFGIPLVHIHVGRGIHVAKGIIAVGNISIGVLSIGILALGGLSIGALAAGLVSLAALAIGLLLGAGGIAAGIVAIGGLALGILTIGGLSIGMFSLGGCAVASHIAIGGYASGHIAIGDAVNGAYTLAIQNDDFGSIRAEQVRQLIQQEYPNLWKPLAERIIGMFN
ncbi:DNA-binding XRE family transcriptional regulator [Fontibacillus phaseoli]|uniref:DNA-binding XRE family transcriptional regulator n=2 Tax=Fontibacillus phaseoli TaxID=1416533 RepID=A0A369BQ17_9BACL|nr:DNA-binding XRE family transcriptional regulator [Fontibacillus phaseoli]